MAATTIGANIEAGSGQGVLDFIKVFIAKKGIDAAGAVIILLVGCLAARWIGRALQRSLEKKDMEPPIRMLILRLTKLLILVLTLLSIVVTPASRARAITSSRSASYSWPSI